MPERDIIQCILEAYHAFRQQNEHPPTKLILSEARYHELKRILERNSMMPRRLTHRAEEFNGMLIIVDERMRDDFLKIEGGEGSRTHVKSMIGWPPKTQPSRA